MILFGKYCRRYIQDTIAASGQDGHELRWWYTELGRRDANRTNETARGAHA